MQIKNIECSKYNNYNFYSLIIEFDNIFTNINENDKNNFLDYIMNNDKEIYYKFGLNDIEIDNLKNYDNIFEFIDNNEKNILAITAYK